MSFTFRLSSHCNKSFCSCSDSWFISSAFRPDKTDLIRWIYGSAICQLFIEFFFSQKIQFDRNVHMKSHTELNFGCVDSFFPFFCTQLSACSWWEWCSLVNWLRFVRWTNSVRKERKEDRVAQLKYENDLITFYQILWFNTKKGDIRKSWI